MTSQSASEARNPVVPWWLVLIEGIAAILVGILLFMRPTGTLTLLIQFLGIYWLVTGIFSLISLLWDRSEWGWKLANGILGLLAGILIIQNPLWSTLLVPASLAIVIALTGIVIGVIQLVEAFKGGGWGTGILGALSILLGLLLLTRPAIAGLALPWLLAVLLLAGGVVALFAAFGLRSAEKQAREARALAATRTPPVYVRREAAGVAGAMRSEAVGTAVGAVGLAEAGVEAAKQVEESAPEGSSAEVESMPGAVQDGVESARSVTAEVPEVVLTGNVDPADPIEMAKFQYALEYVEGIGAAYAGKLSAMGLTTCLDLLKSGATRKGREEIAEKSGISSKLVLEWINHVDLFRIKGVGSEYADLLEAAGVDTVLELAQRNPANLFDRLNTVNLEKKLVRKLPTQYQVEDWVTQAKELPRIITY